MLTMRQIKAYVRYKLGLTKHLFIHIPKNGGMAVRNSKELRRRLIFSDPYFHISREYTNAVCRTMAYDKKSYNLRHARLRDIHPNVVSRVQPIAIIRNPWRRTLSRFTFRYKYQEIAGKEVDFSRRNFEAFLDERHKWGGKEYYWHRAIQGWYPQTDYVVDQHNNLACDIFRQEFLVEELRRYFGPVEIPKRNQSGRTCTDYRYLYTDKTIQIVADWYAKDIETFGFDFDTPATKNYCFAETEAHQVNSEDHDKAFAKRAA